MPRKKTSAWSRIGGEWPADMMGAAPEKRLAYGLLRGAVETLVLRSDGHETHPDIDDLSVTDDYWNARSWVFSDDFKTDGISIDTVCETIGFSKTVLRSVLKEAGI